jgi:DNA polymerase III delta prime subunit
MSCSPPPFFQTFITKYKPYYIDEFTTDPKMISVVKTLIEIDDINALFIGNPSSGKTTLLYALIRNYYGLSKTDSIPENNILFINNLKEQGINFYRNEMKTFCQSHCSIFHKKKMVVIDDIDSINEQSQQVFRNYMDKYKKNVNFISVCTNIQKVIESIQSRVHIINISPPNVIQLKEIMEKIIKNENLIIDEISKDYLLQISNNSIRCLINNLEKIFILEEPIDLPLCKRLCSNISFQLFENYIEAIQNRQLTKAIEILYNIYDYGYSVIDILDYFFTFVKITDTLEEEEKYRMIPFICKYITIFHNLHEDVIELALFTNNIYKVVHENIDELSA